MKVDGAKNAALPLIAAALLGTKPVILEDVPDLADVEVILDVIQMLGARVDYSREDHTIKINAETLNNFSTPYDLMSKMRASFLVMGPLLARLGRTEISMPGGCAIGKRPIDLHLKGFRALGAEIVENTSTIGATAPNGLVGDLVYLDFPSVGATQNLMMAATHAEGETLIENAAKEPEIVDLANFLNKMGADVRGAGTSSIRIKGVKQLGGAVHQIIPDRVEASTYMVAAAITGGDIVIENVITSHIRPVIAKLKEVGCRIIDNSDEDMLRIIGPERPKATSIRTLPYPGFPTDAQAQFMALMTICDGHSEVEETVFENRFMHVDELSKMGALIATDGNEAKIRGIPSLHGARVRATDLRAGAALVLAGLVADGETVVDDIYHIDRGYSDLVGKLRGLGADVERR